MITRLNAKEFQNLQGIEFGKLSRFTLLSGYNNVGKSTILEAIFTLFDRYNPYIFKILMLG